MDFSHNVDRHDGTANLRVSMASRMSRLFSRRRDEHSVMGDSQRTSGACEVPIFMSTPRNQPEQAMLSSATYHQPTTIPASSVYSASPGQQHHTQVEDHVEDESPWSPGSVEDLERGTSPVSYATSETQLVREKRRKRRRVGESIRQKIASKKRLSMAFGVTVIATIITCKSCCCSVLILC